MTPGQCHICGRPKYHRDRASADACLRWTQGREDNEKVLAGCYYLGYEREKVRADASETALADAVADIRLDIDLLARAECQINDLKAERDKWKADAESLLPRAAVAEAKVGMFMTERARLEAPSPGSVVAVMRGCRCHTDDNNDGRGCFNTKTGTLRFRCALDCPLHGDAQ